MCIGTSEWRRLVLTTLQESRTVSGKPEEVHGYTNAQLKNEPTFDVIGKHF